MPDYSRGKIYKITSGDLTYIGSTCEPTLAKRLASHVSSYKQWKAGKGGNIRSFQLIESGQYEITLIELCPCGSKDELRARERFHIENTICVNKRIEGRTLQEYRDTHKDKNNAYFKVYREENKESILEKMKTYYQVNQESILEKKRAYREANRDKINAKQRERRKSLL